MKNTHLHQRTLRSSLGALGALASLSLAVSPAQAFSGQPPPNRTGAPGSVGTCADCHTSQGSGSVALDFAGGAFTYEPSQTYTLRVNISDPGQKRFGFSMTARQTDVPTNTAGTWTAGLNSVVYDGGNHIGHMNAPFVDDAQTFEVMWTAPASDVGPITFYYIANAANGNFANGIGDHIYSGNLTIDIAAAPVSFWADSPATSSGWRLSGQAYPDVVGLGWIWDRYWPWIYTTSLGDPNGDWIYVQTSGGNRYGFWGYNADGGYWFWGAARIGWYYSFDAQSPGWFPFQ